MPSSYSVRIVSARWHFCICRARFASLPLLVSLAAACGDARGPQQAAASAAHPDSAAVAEVGRRFGEARVAWDDTAAAVPGTAWRSGILRYDTPGDSTRYGSVVALWNAEDGRVVWTHDHPGDFAPHRLVWTDADADRQPDLFFTAGHEDVFETYLFRNRIGGGTAADSAFAMAYRSDTQYTTLLDLDGDGAPELIEGGYPKDLEADDDDPCAETPLPAEVHAAAEQEYARRVGAFDAANFRYGLGPGEFEPITLHLMVPIRILQIRDGAPHDATRDFPGHLRWRADLLRQYRASADASCRAHLDGLIRYLDGAARAS